jgi:HK97 family phage portal protein
MNILKKIFKRKNVPAPDDDFWYFPYGATAPTVSGVKVDEQTAIKYLTVYDCVSLVSGDVSNLPLLLYKRVGKGKERASYHPKYDLIHTAINEEITSRSWIESGISHNMLWGNHYSLKVFNRMGQLIELWPIPDPGSVEVYRSKEDFRIHYKWKVKGGQTIDKTRDEILHIPGWGFNGLVGLSPIAIAREAVGLGLATEYFAENFFGNGTHPAGILALPPEMSRMDEKKAMEYLASVESQVKGLGKSHSIMMTRNGEKYTPLTMPLDDAQFLESRQFQKLEIAGMYHVPPHKIAIHGANSNYNNEEQENRHYVDSCLLSWVRRWETCLNQQILTREERLQGLFFEFKLDGLLRGDSQARVAYYTGLKNIGAITNNEIRSLENLNPLAEDQRGDETTIPLNFMFVTDLPKMEALSNKEGPLDFQERSRLMSWAKQVTEKRSTILQRDRIAKNYTPLIHAAADVVVAKEVKSIQVQINKMRSERVYDVNLLEWILDFYEGLGEYIKAKVGPVLRSFAMAIAQVVLDEIGEDVIAEEDIEEFLTDYVNVYIIRYISSSFGQMKSLMNEENYGDLIYERTEEWREKKADKVAMDESTRIPNATFTKLAFIAGLSTVIRIRGAKTCKYCRTLNGKKVSSGEPVLRPGDSIVPDEESSPMNFNSIKYHPPFHRGCDCYIDIA